MSLKATDILRIDLRRQRAIPLMHAILEIVKPHLRDTEDMRYLHDEIGQKLFEAGAEIITDDMRAKAGLPPRGPDGWTDEELLALEKARLAIIARPVYFFDGPPSNPKALGDLDDRITS